MSFDEWVLQLAIGLSFGLLLFLLASGFTLTFGLARFVNLSHGAVFLVAAYVATEVGGPGWRFALGVLAAGLTGLVLSLATYGIARLRWSRLGSDELSQVLLTFGVLLVFCFDYADNPEAWHTSMRLLTEEVMPLCADLVPKEPVASR